MKNTYFVGVNTFEFFGPEEYSVEAGKMANLLKDTFADRDKLAIITKQAELTGANIEAEVAYCSERGLVGRCVLDLESDKRTTLDKTKMTSLLRSASAWPNMKVEKRVVDT